MLLKAIHAKILYSLGKSTKNPLFLKKAAILNPKNLHYTEALACNGETRSAGTALMLALGIYAKAKRNTKQQDGEKLENEDFIAFLSSHLQTSSSQIFQDIAALYYFRKAGERSSGYFVEVGTGDGINLSNTFMLERYHRWMGLLFEPDKRFHNEIKKTRTAELITKPAWEKAGVEIDFIQSNRSGALSTISEFKNSDGRSRKGHHNNLITTTLNDELEMRKAPLIIDFMSIDTEGSEINILRGLDFSKYTIKFLAIEHNYIPGKKAEIISLLAPHGFHPVLEDFSGIDIWLVNTTPPRS